MNENWNVWSIENPILRILAAWAIVLFIIPPVLVIDVVYRFFRAVIHDVFYGSRTYGLKAFWEESVYLYTDHKEWGYVWQAMTSLKKKE